DDLVAPQADPAGVEGVGALGDQQHAQRPAHGGRDGLGARSAGARSVRGRPVGPGDGRSSVGAQAHPAGHRGLAVRVTVSPSVRPSRDTVSEPYFSASSGPRWSAAVAGRVSTPVTNSELS